MRLFVTLILYTFLLENSSSREYHYDKPATPFFAGEANYAQTQANYFPPTHGVPQQPPPQSNGHSNLPAVIRTYGPTARDFLVSGVTSAHQVFEGRQLPPVSATHVAQPRQNHHAQYHTIAPQGVYLPPPPPPGYQQPGKSAHHRQPAQQAGYSARVNPFNQVAYPQGSGGANYPQTGGTYNGAAAQGSYNGQYNGAAQQNSANYGAPYQQAGASGGAYGNIGNYVSQSESGQLDGYPYKQIDGDSRPFKRIISTCYPNGQCVPTTLDGGPATQAGDARHQHFVVSARARISPASDKCQRIAEAKRAASAYGAPSAGGPSAAGQSLRPNYANAAGYTGQNQNSYAPPAGNYASPPSANYAAAPSGNYAAPQNVAGGNFGGNFGGNSGGNFGGNFGSSLTSPGNNGGFTGATNGIDGDYVAPASQSGRPDGPVRPLNRRLFQYSEVVLKQDPFN